MRSIKARCLKWYCNKTANINVKKLISLKLSVRATFIALKLQISFCQDSLPNIGERPYVYKRSSIQTRWHELFQPASDTSIRLRITNPHHRVDKNGVHVKITTFSCIKFNKKIYIFHLFLLKILDHVTQIKSEIIKSFFTLSEPVNAM